MSKPLNKILLSVKIVAFVVTLLLVLFYSYLPQRQLLLHPNTQNTYAVSVDAEIGGASEFAWRDEKNRSWVCQIKSGAPYPYCGLSLLWSADLSKTIDFSLYSNLHLELEYHGPTPHIRVFIRDDYPQSQYPDPLKKAKFNNIVLRAEQGVQNISIPLSELTVAEWWVNDFDVPLENRKPSVKHVIALGVDSPYPVVLGDHQFSLAKVELVGSYFSKELMYISIISFWGILLLSEMLINYADMRSKLHQGKQQLTELAATSARYKEQSETDKLTGILNRVGLEAIVSHLDSHKLLQQYALLVIDIDYFKQVNDKFGHAEGDKVLAHIAKCITGCCRSYDVVARWGGEEFVVLMHCISPETIKPFAEKIRLHIAEHALFTGTTVSIGGTKLINHAAFNDCFVIADQALYQAKTNGRNQVVIL